MEDQAEICAELKRLEQQLALLAAEEQIALPERTWTQATAACASAEQRGAAAKTNRINSRASGAVSSNPRQSPPHAEGKLLSHSQNDDRVAAGYVQDGTGAASQAAHMQQQQLQQHQHLPQHDIASSQTAQGVTGAAAAASTAGAAVLAERPADGKKPKQHRQSPPGTTAATIQLLAPHAPTPAAVETAAAVEAQAAAHAAAGHMPAELVQELLQQHSKLLDLMQTMASTAKTQAERSSRLEQQHQLQQQAANTAAAAAATALGSTAATGSHAAAAPAGSSTAPRAQQQQQHQQCEAQLAEQHQLKRRFVKVQKVLLQHVQEARLQAAAAEAAREHACRREHESAAAAAALHTQLIQQQQQAQSQQHELSCMQQQLLHVKELHKRKMHQLKAQLRQQYEVQLQATTAAYAHELAQIQSHLAYSKMNGGLRASSTAAAAAAGSIAAGAAGQDMSSLNSSPRPSMMQQLGQHMSSGNSPVRSPVRMLPHRNLQQVHQQPPPPQQQPPPPQQHAQVPAGYIHEQQYHHHHQQQQQLSSGQDLNVPAEVLEYAEQYQQGGEGNVRPSSAAPSVLQRQRCKEPPVPEVAAQLAQHFAAGGEGIGRPLSAPSSDRYGLQALQQQNQQRNSCGSPQRSGRPSLRNSCEEPIAAGVSVNASVDLPAYILASDSLWDALCG